MILDRVDKIADVIRDEAGAAERLGRLTPPVVDALHDEELFRMMIPIQFGGLGLSIPDFVAVIERVASFDASTGWTLGILAGGGLLNRQFPPETFVTTCGESFGLVAGTINPTARIERVEGGFAYTGRATYLSGSAHASWILVSGIVPEEPVEFRVALIPIDKARSLDTWNVTGMRATSSTDYELHDVVVAPEWTFEPLRPRAASTGDVFDTIPLWAQLGSPLAACAVGAAANMIGRFVELAATKVPAGASTARLAERAPAQIAVGEAQGLYQASRAVLMETVAEVWARGVAREPFDNAALARQRLGLVTAVQLSARAIDLLHDVAGMNAVTRDTVLERCWRDVHTITQHIILSPTRFEIAGRVVLGEDPGSPII